MSADDNPLDIDDKIKMAKAVQEELRQNLQNQRSRAPIDMKLFQRTKEEIKWIKELLLKLHKKKYNIK